MHHMAAAALSAPELVIQESDAKSLAIAIAEVSKHYPMTIDPKTMAWVNLVSAAGMIYGPRFYFINQRKKEEGKKNKAPSHGDASVSILHGLGNA